jgi:hypothetical protein
MKEQRKYGCFLLNYHDGVFFVRVVGESEVLAIFAFFLIRKKKKKNNLKLLRSTSLLVLGRQERSVDVGKNTTLGNSDVTKELVQFFIVTDGQLKMARDDTRLLVITSGVTGQFEDFSSQVFEDGSQVDGSTSTNTLGIVTATKETVNTTDRELKTGLRRAGLRLGASSRLSTRFSTRHIYYFFREM